VRGEYIAGRISLEEWGTTSTPSPRGPRALADRSARSRIRSCTVVGHETVADGRIGRIDRPGVALGDSADRLSERVAGHTQQPPHPIRRVIMVEVDGTA
jgi:hypothetical protein